MNWEGWFVLTIIAVLVFGLARNWSSDWVCIGCLAILMAVGEVTGSPLLPTPTLAISGFGEKVLVTIGALFVVVTGLVQTGALAVAAKAVLGQPKTILSAQIRLLLPVTALSAFLNNTPVVAMFMPIVSDLCRKHRLSPSKLFLPLSYASIFGGCLTIIGTSTNIIVSDMLKQNGLRELSFLNPCGSAYRRRLWGFCIFLSQVDGFFPIGTLPLTCPMIRDSNRVAAVDLPFVDALSATPRSSLGYAALN